ncbi:ATP-binding protein [Roseateles asaccharophilus]|uniref:histidine kinase n=1 Tax=Roseateles asaccharophilus TaxID=582607 RepID=A0ABU2A1R3_9BURK|nr:ATP-binding protein [Roseateles asaccharophilus]MDR7331125.1 signal transduction histidine kinase [Roseateles asaccharophilus]
MTGRRFRPGWPRSLQGQLVLWLLPLQLLMTGGLAWLFADNYAVTVFHFMDGQMQTLARSNAARTCASLDQPVPQQVPEEVHEGGEFVVQLWCAQDPARQVSGLPSAAVPLQDEPGWHEVWIGDAHWRVFTAPAGTGEVRVQVAQSLFFRKLEVGGRTFLASLVGLLLLPVSVFVLARVVGRASRRLENSAQQLAQRDEHSTAPADLQVPCEIEPLVQAFESLLARLRGALASQRLFVQDAAHELRTPLTALSLQLENLRPHMGGAAAEFEQLQQGMRRARHLVDQMLSLSRQDLAPHATAAPLDLRELLRASIGQAMAEADRRGVEVGFVDAVDGPVALQGQEGDLRSLFDNLITNALRHSPPGAEVELRLTPQWVDIIDNGPGLPETMRERVFDRFFRMPDAPAGGSGLGLAIARQAGLRHGLRIELRGREDGRSGLVARVHLP